MCVREREKEKQWRREKRDGEEEREGRQGRRRRTHNGGLSGISLSGSVTKETKFPSFFNFFDFDAELFSEDAAPSFRLLVRPLSCHTSRLSGSWVEKDIIIIVAQR